MIYSPTLFQVVKLGTITPSGADVYSYAEEEDDMVEDPKVGRACLALTKFTIDGQSFFRLLLVHFVSGQEDDVKTEEREYHQGSLR